VTRGSPAGSDLPGQKKVVVRALLPGRDRAPATNSASIYAVEDRIPEELFPQLRAVSSRRRSARRSTFAVGPSRRDCQRSSTRHHVLRRRSFSRDRSSSDHPQQSLSHHPVGHRRRVAGLSSRANDRRLNPRLLDKQSRLDLTQLDAEPTHFHLASIRPRYASSPEALPAAKGSPDRYTAPPTGSHRKPSGNERKESKIRKKKVTMRHSTTQTTNSEARHFPPATGAPNRNRPRRTPPDPASGTPIPCPAPPRISTPTNGAQRHVTPSSP